MDIITQAKDNDKQTRINTNINLGMISSSLEHQVPKMMFNEVEPNNQSYTQAVSAIKLLQLANTQHQKIYKITKENIDTILPNLHVKQVTKQDIRLHVNNNNYVITHEKSITLDGWNGDGYIVMDPNTGSGAYKISGGMNGGFLSIIKALSGLSTIPIISSFANVLILIPLVIKALDVIEKCPKTASYIVSGMMIMSAVILGLSFVIATLINPLLGYALSVSTMYILKQSIKTNQCR